ncbi:MAG: FAD-binding protein [Planctomycetes bacterium]|nr:FAD-binding protein [Planctomycetota bacterium]
MLSSLTWPIAALHNADLGARTTMRVGGRAEWLLEPATPDEFVLAVNAARERGCEPRILGGGANLIVDDGLLPGVVIATDRIKRVFRPSGPQAAVEFEPAHDQANIAPADPAADPRLIAWCGASMPGLMQTATALGLTGLECLAGVPGHLGGGVVMNAGGRYGELWDVIELVRVLERDGTLRDIARSEHQPRYRNGGLGERIVLGAVLRLKHEGTAAVRERAKEYLLEKRRVQPVTEWSAGCVFKNPDKERAAGASAGMLIDRLGLKGRTRGDAIVSTLHGNFIVNRGKATAADVLGLMEELRSEVAERSGIVLESEWRIWRAGDVRSA